MTILLTDRKPAAMDRIDTVALAHDWWTSAQRRYADSSAIITTYAKGSRYVTVTYSVRGTVTTATTDRDHFTGTGKAEQVIAFLESSPS